MFANIKTKSLPSQNSSFLHLIRDLLTGAVTSANDLDPVYYDILVSSVVAGTNGGSDFPSWTVLWSSNADPALATACILTSPSFDTSRTNFLKLSIGTGSGNLNITTGTAHLGNGLLANEVFIPGATVSAATNLFNDYLSYKNLFIAANDHSLVITNLYSTNGFSTTDGIFIAVDMVNAQHSRYVNEGSMKIGYASNSSLQLNVSNFYNPRLDMYTGSTPITVSAYNTANVFSSVAISRQEDIQANMNLLIPLEVCRLQDGWLGEDISAVCGLYLSTSTLFVDGELTTLGYTRFYALNPTTNKTPSNITRFLIQE